MNKEATLLRPTTYPAAVRAGAPSCVRRRLLACRIAILAAMLLFPMLAPSVSAQEILYEPLVPSFLSGDRLGSSVVAVGDEDSDGLPAFVLSAPGCDWLYADSGCIVKVELDSDLVATSILAIQAADGGGIESLFAVGSLDLGKTTHLLVEGPFVTTVRDLADGDAWINRLIRSDLSTEGGFDFRDEDRDLWGGILGGAAIGDLDGTGTGDFAVRISNRVLVWFSRTFSLNTVTTTTHPEYSVEWAVPAGVGPGSLTSIPGAVDGLHDLVLSGATGTLVVRLGPGGQPASSVLTSHESAGWPAEYLNAPAFGQVVQSLGDVDGDGRVEIGLGLPDVDEGVVLIASVGADSRIQYRATLRGRDVQQNLKTGDAFGASMAAAAMGDEMVMLVGAPGMDEGGTDTGGVIAFTLSPDFEVGSHRLLGGTQPEWQNLPFSSAILRSMGDMNADGYPDYLGGSPAALGQGYERLAGATIFMGGPGNSVSSRIPIRFEVDGQQHGLMYAQVSPIGDVNGDGVVDLFWREPQVSGNSKVFMLHMAPDGSVGLVLEVPFDVMNLVTPSDVDFASPFVAGADFDGNGAIDLVQLRNGGGCVNPAGAFDFVWTATMAVDGMSFGAIESRISGDWFTAPARGVPCTAYPMLYRAGDINGDGVPDLVSGLTGRPPALGYYPMGQEGYAAGQIVVTSNEAGANLPTTGSLRVLSDLGDMDGDGINELLVLHNGGTLTLERTLLLVVAGEQGIPKQTFELVREVDDPGFFARALGYVSVAGDLTGDGIPELAVGRASQPRGLTNNDFRSTPAGVAIVDISEWMPLRVSDPTSDPAIPEDGRRISFSTRVAYSDAAQQVRMFFRQGGETTSFFSVDMTRGSGSEWTADLPSIFSSVRGIEYYLTTRSMKGVEYRYPSEGYLSMPIHSVKGVSVPLLPGTEADGYRILGSPLAADDERAAVRMESSLGPFDPSRWRVFFGAGGSDELDPNGEQVIRPGVGFWVLTREVGRSFSTGAGTSLATDTVFSAAVGQGWSLIANPFPFDIEPSRIRFVSGRPVDIRRFDGAWRSVSASDTIRVFEGLAIYRGSQAEEIQVWPPGLPMPAGKRGDPREAASVTSHEASALDASMGSRSSRSSAAMTVSASSTGSVLSREWRVRVTARRGAARDEDTVLGVASGADEGLDAWDRPEAPRIGAWVGVALRHPDPSAPEPLYTSDMRPVGGSEYTWTLDVSSAEPGRVLLVFDAAGELPDGWSLWMEDRAAGVTQDVTRRPTYAVAVGASDPRSLTLTARYGGSAAQDEVLPTEIALDPVFPNPFFGATTIPVDVPETAAVRLEVYDTLGRRVALLLDGTLSAGRHAVVWDSAVANPGPGVYFLRLTAGQTVKQRSVTLLR